RQSATVCRIVFDTSRAALPGVRGTAQKNAPDLLANSSAARLAGGANSVARLAQALDEHVQLRALPRAVDSFESDERAARLQRRSPVYPRFQLSAAVSSQFSANQSAGRCFVSLN